MPRDYFKSGVEQLASAILSFLCGGSAHLSCPVYSLTLGLCSAGAPEPALSLNWGQKKQTQSSCLDMPCRLSELPENIPLLSTIALTLKAFYISFQLTWIIR